MEAVFRWEAMTWRSLYESSYIKPTASPLYIYGHVNTNNNPQIYVNDRWFLCWSNGLQTISVKGYIKLIFKLQHLEIKIEAHIHGF